MQEKRTKIICTISDINCDVEFIEKLFKSGMNLVRINSAHASIEGAQRIVDNTRAVSDKIGIMIDTKGPEVRLAPMDTSVGFAVSTDEEIVIKAGEGKCSHGILYTNCRSFVHDVPEGAHVLIDDGSVDLFVEHKSEEQLECRVMNAGVIKGKKSVNVPNVKICLPALTPKDRKFVEWAIEANVDFIAHSFVRSKEDVQEIQNLLDVHHSEAKIISKIENQQGVDNLEEILIGSYGVMVARGDLGVEIPAERIPLIQNEIVQKCRRFRKPVIIATQMLHSMIENPRPTRAEVTDIANAIFQRTDAIMLSGETAQGKYPVECVEMMYKIAREAEKSTDASLDMKYNLVQDHIMKPIAATLARNLVEASIQLPVKAIIFDTWTGRTGRYLAEFRPKVPIYAMCYQERTMRELAMIFGIYCYAFHPFKTKEEMVSNAIKLLKKEGRLEEGDLVGIIGGSFKSEIGATYLEFKYVEKD